MHEALDEPTRIPGLQLLEIPGDPTTLPSEHAERINALESQIAEKDVVPCFFLVASINTTKQLDGATCLGQCKNSLKGW